MTSLWYQDPNILLNDLDQFIPDKKFNRNEKINALARFAIYLAILIIVCEQDTKWLSLSVIILLISIFLGTSENFSNNIIIKNCQGPVKDNPFMNFTHGDHIAHPNRLKACNYDDVKNKMRSEFRSHVYTDTNDIWGKFISDRNFYSMPNTEIVNDQTGFALWCFGNSGQCKAEGLNCLKQRDPTYHRGRITTLDDD
jgi:hypothetical protein